MPVRLAPIQRKTRIAESTVFSELNVVKFAEVVGVQLEQIRQYRLLLRRGRNELNTCHHAQIDVHSTLDARCDLPENQVCNAASNSLSHKPTILECGLALLIKKAAPHKQISVSSRSPGLVPKTETNG